MNRELSNEAKARLNHIIEKRRSLLVSRMEKSLLHSIVSFDAVSELLTFFENAKSAANPREVVLLCLAMAKKRRHGYFIGFFMAQLDEYGGLNISALTERERVLICFGKDVLDQREARLRQLFSQEESVLFATIASTMLMVLTLSGLLDPMD